MRSSGVKLSVLTPRRFSKAELEINRGGSSQSTAAGAFASSTSSDAARTQSGQELRGPYTASHATTFSLRERSCGAARPGKGEFLLTIFYLSKTGPALSEVKDGGRAKGSAACPAMMLFGGNVPTPFAIALIYL
ncbi:hypothetical protein [Pseudotabrizicola algicola]|uniref:Uncharacterized protein n=1 Tax=Pseudotabrizicola algicola TaxID=2709381 RepID=A0A6B3RR58_9RHOB|nr:hypothetical protein [Pseudotabrizicola algicola]NEX46465.1 hypothetical protein [Pseudotabrizicola algicola]